MKLSFGVFLIGTHRWQDHLAKSAIIRVPSISLAEVLIRCYYIRSIGFGAILCSAIRGRCFAHLVRIKVLDLLFVCFIGLCFINEYCQLDLITDLPEFQLANE